MLKSDRDPQIWRPAALAAFVALAGLTAHFAESSSQLVGTAVTSEVRAYLAATSGYTIPKPSDVPLAEAKLIAAAAKIREGLAPNRQQVRRQARLETLTAIRSAYTDSLLAADSIVGVGIGIPQQGLKRSQTDWELLVLVAPDATEKDAAFVLETTGVAGLLTDFDVRFERVKTPVLTAGERPGRTRIWAGSQTGDVCHSVGTMGWLVQSNQADEIHGGNDEASGNQSIGFLTVLHGTAAGATHTWEEFQTIPREIQWTDFAFSCDAFSEAGRVIRPGPHAGIDDVEDLTQDIDFVSLYSEQACDQAVADNETEGFPRCDGFGDGVEGYAAQAIPVDPDEIDLVSGMTAQICGGNTGQLRSGGLDAIQVALELPILGWDGNPVAPPQTVTVENTFRIRNDIADPAFSQAGDSGGPVWLLDDTAPVGERVWRPLGVQAAINTSADGMIAYSYVTPLPDNLRAFDVNVIFNNPYDPGSEFCTTCNCDCRAESFGVGPREGRLFLDTAVATSPSAVRQLTSLAIRHEQELSTLLEARGVEVYRSLFEKDLAPYLRAAFNPPASRPKLTSREVSSTLQILSWIHDSVRSQELQAEASKWYRFVAVYGEGRDFQELVRLYFLTSASTFETKIAAR